MILCQYSTQCCLFFFSELRIQKSEPRPVKKVTPPPSSNRPTKKPDDVKKGPLGPVRKTSSGVAKHNAINANNNNNVDTPDVIRVGMKQKTFSFLESRITSLECDLLRNQSQLDSKQVAFETLISQMKRNADGFEAMAVLVNHLSLRSTVGHFTY